MTAPSPITTIMSGKQCVGFIFKRAHLGYEAWDQDRSLGMFKDRESAAAAVIEANREV